MVKWRYVGPKYARGVLLRDGSMVFPEDILDDAYINTILAKYPELAPYWRDVDKDNDGVVDDATDGSDGSAVDFTPLSNAMTAATVEVQNLFNSII